MSLLIAGSIATDHLMSFGGRFEDSLVVEQLSKLSVSFLVDDLEIRRGGVAPNICFGLAGLGLRPVLVGAAGEDFADYRSWLERHGVDCSHVRISESKHTARFVCTTDTTMAQFASFYPGAMSEARLIELEPIVARVGAPTYVLIGADDPDGMLRHTEECRQRGYPFIADPSQQLAFGEGDLIRQLVDGAAILLTNEYESHLIEQKTGWSADDVLARVGIQVTTLGKDGVRVLRKGEEPIVVPAARNVTAIEPTGVGDGFRAGFLAASEWGLGLERAAQVGCVLAAYVVETVGTQEYSFTRAEFLARFEDSYGDAAAAEVAPHLAV
ncbi:carbohydrate kinase family protein [Nocardioides sp. dk4132]|uniref:carbohydrate kinase family protein n=1 Tax=unclassified Nocardioides TaxID=2615069 RepID=UPI001294F5E9|nr:MULTISPECIES: carbohydrate kinase family protein [unclassified Nocardioides]MQW76544.1 carbohydrate kinase family protein [Nocardioides sp. dk4132]QGA07197.1 carbohydrate kinase family protein [Nocardioides sp. dk884]